MKKNKFTLNSLAFSLIILCVIACDKDYTDIESDIINNDNATSFDIKRDTFNIITYNDTLAPVQTNGLGLNMLGVYDDSYGRTSSSFVTQLALANYAPKFGDSIKMDSVVLTIPYFSTTERDSDNAITYELDSIIGKDSLSLRLYESNYFIRDFDPNAEFNDSQTYFSNFPETIDNTILKGQELSYINSNNQLETGSYKLGINKAGYILTDVNETDDNGAAMVLLRQGPGIRIKLDTTYWREKIIKKEDETVLRTANNFSEYFRGIYFKAEPNPNTNKGSFIILNTTSNANITIYYTRLTASTTDDAGEREQNTFVINFVENQINFIKNDFIKPPMNIDSINGDSKLYIKGGEASIAKIRLFNKENFDDIPEMNTFETFKNSFVETDAKGKFVKSKRLVNEANLVFYVDRSTLDIANENPENEPNRMFLYDVDNKTPLVDYFLDVTSNTNFPEFSISEHLGRLQRVDDKPNGKGIKYKLKITEHINNLLLRDSTNVELGLAISANVNLEGLQVQRRVQTDNNIDITVPISSIVTPRGTVLHGNATGDNTKKVFLEIYYTEPEN